MWYKIKTKWEETLVNLERYSRISKERGNNIIFHLSENFENIIMEFPTEQERDIEFNKVENIIMKQREVLQGDPPNLNIADDLEKAPWDDN